MARSWNKLTANFVRSARERGRYADGGNLHLQISKRGTKAWVFQYQRNGTPRAMGLGSTRIVTLSLARELAAGCREQLARGTDPIDAREAAHLAAKAARAKLTTFKQCAEEYHAANLRRWTNEKHRKEWISAMRRFAFPVIGHLSVDGIDSGLIHRVLQPLATEKSITSSRLRGRIEDVLDAAKAAGRRSGDNPAAKEIIGHMLPMKSEKADVVHQPALPYAKMPTFMAALRAVPGKAARQLELQVLTVMRSDAVRLARLAEFDLDAAVWTIPPARMKAMSNSHRIPLGPRAVEIVRELKAAAAGELLFGGANGRDRPIGKNEAGKVLAKVLEMIKHDDPVVPHGFRSCFKDWCHEERDHRTEVVELALAHKIKSSVERAYRRGDLLKRREALMIDWENYCGGIEANKVIPLRA